MAKSATVGKLNWILGASAGGFNAAITGVQQTLGNLNRTATARFASLGTAASGVTRQFSAMGQAIANSAGFVGSSLTGAGIALIGAHAIKTAADLEAMRASFRQLIGDVKEADQTFERMRRFADWSPFSTEQVLQAGSVLSTQFSASEIMPLLQILGELSAASKQPINELALVLGDVRAKGKLAGEEIRQFGSRSIPLPKMLAESMGVAESAIRDMASEGKISFADVAKALARATTEGGKFAGAMQAYANSTAGRWEQFRSLLTRFSATVGTALLPAANRVLVWATAFVQVMTSANATTVQNILKLTMWAGGLALAAVAIGGVIRAIQAAVVAFRSLAIAQTIAQAVGGGPAAWAKIAAGIAIAAGAAYLVSEAFNEVSAEVAQVSSNAQVGSEEMRRFIASLKDTGPAIDEGIAQPINEASLAFDKLRQKAASLTEQFRTPQQVFRDTITELVNLSRAGLLDQGTFGRAFEKAKTDLAEALKTSKELTRSTQGVGAAIAGTSAGFSAVQEANRQSDALREQTKIEQEQLAVLKKQEQWLADLVKGEAVKPPQLVADF